MEKFFLQLVFQGLERWRRTRASQRARDGEGTEHKALLFVYTTWRLHLIWEGDDGERVDNTPGSAGDLSLEKPEHTHPCPVSHIPQIQQLDLRYVGNVLWWWGCSICANMTATWLLSSEMWLLRLKNWVFIFELALNVISMWTKRGHVLTSREAPKAGSLANSET